MSLIDLINSFMPKSYSQLDQIKATVITTTSVAIGGAMFFLVLYWLITKALKKKETIFVMLIIMLLLAGCIGLVMRGQVTAGAWMLTALMLIINFSNMAWYGISTTSSAAFIIPILVAISCIGSNAGWAITILGCIYVFTIPILQSNEVIKTVLPFKISSLTFDAPVLTLIYLLVAIIANSWAGAVKNTFLNS